MYRTRAIYTIHYLVIVLLSIPSSYFPTVHSRGVTSYSLRTSGSITLKQGQHTITRSKGNVLQLDCDIRKGICRDELLPSTVECRHDVVEGSEGMAHRHSDALRANHPIPRCLVLTALRLFLLHSPILCLVRWECTPFGQPSGYVLDNTHRVICEPASRSSSKGDSGVSDQEGDMEVGWELGEVLSGSCRLVFGMVSENPLRRKGHFDLRKIPMLSFARNRYSERFDAQTRSLVRVEQITYDGGTCPSCGESPPRVVTCRSKMSSKAKSSREIDWTCFSNNARSYRLRNATVECDGMRRRYDFLVVDGSCQVSFALTKVGVKDEGSGRRPGLGRAIILVDYSEVPYLDFNSHTFVTLGQHCGPRDATSQCRPVPQLSCQTGDCTAFTETNRTRGISVRCWNLNYDPLLQRDGRRQYLAQWSCMELPPLGKTPRYIISTPHMQCPPDDVAGDASPLPPPRHAGCNVAVGFHDSDTLAQNIEALYRVQFHRDTRPLRSPMTQAQRDAKADGAGRELPVSQLVYTTSNEPGLDSLVPLITNATCQQRITPMGKHWWYCNHTMTSDARTASRAPDEIYMVNTTVQCDSFDGRPQFVYLPSCSLHYTLSTSPVLPVMDPNTGIVGWLLGNVGIDDTASAPLLLTMICIALATWMWSSRAQSKPKTKGDESTEKTEKAKKEKSKQE